LPQERVARAEGSGTILDAYRAGPLGPFLGAGPIRDLSSAPEILPALGSQPLLFAPWLLQDIGDYRGALQRWFDCLEIGGRLILTVPHAFLYERQDSAPSRRRPAQRRLYTPRALAEELEEALAPNSYRLRWLGDLDEGYDYGAHSPSGRYEVAAVIERIAEPSWGLRPDLPARPAPVDLFEVDHLRVERPVRVPIGRILALKLDHLGDFIMGIPALERLRAAFAEAEITLVVGSWNEALARSLGIADHILVFDAYPRNPSEERVDVAGKAALFDALVTGRYDLAIDLRSDPDTRFLLSHVDAGLRAGIGLKAQFPHLDVFLPLDAGSDRLDTAWSQELALDRFHAPAGIRSRFSIHRPGAAPATEGQALLWGPYIALPPGDYVFEPFVEVGEGGLIAWDVALDLDRIAYAVHPAPGIGEMRFRNDRDGALAEFRIWAVEGEPVADFRFYGGRLSKRGTSSALHQSEYLILLVDLLALRFKERGLVQEEQA
jgi:hypothetical protein